MVQSPSWEANWFAASQEIPHILWNQEVQYRTHKRLPPVPILGQHYTTLYYTILHNTILHYTVLLTVHYTTLYYTIPYHTIP